jgi:hypothetical protein
MNAIDMAPFTAWLPPRSNQDMDLILKIMGASASTLVKDWAMIAQSFIRKGLWVMTQSDRLNNERGTFVLTIRLATKPFYSLGSGCDILVDLTNTNPKCQRFRLQPGSVLIWEPSPDEQTHRVLSQGVVAYPIPLKELAGRQDEGFHGKAFVALGVLLHLLGVSESTLCRWTPSLSAPRSFTAGHDYARQYVEKRDVYALPSLSADPRCGMFLSAEKAILLGFAANACENRNACESELMTNPWHWVAHHLDRAQSKVSMLQSDWHPGMQVYRGPGGKVMVLSRADASAIGSCLKRFTASHVFVAADIADALRLTILGHDLIHTGACDRVAIVVEDAIALRQQTVEVRSVVDMIRRRCNAEGCVRDEGLAPCERDGDSDADVGYVAWGAAQGVVRDAVEVCRSFGLRVAGFYPKAIRPFQHQAMEAFAKTVDRVVLVDSDPALGYWVKLQTGFSFEYSLLTPPPGQSLTPMDIFLREGLGAE